MRAGLLSTRVTVQQRSAGQDSIGQPVETWTTYATVWADVRQTSGVEAIKGEGVMASTRASIRVRHNAGITTGMRVVCGSTTYDIKAVLQDVAKREFTDLACEVLA